MLKSKIIYSALLIVCVVFFILYVQPFSLYLLIFIALLPVFLGICTILARLFISVEVSSDCEYSIKNTDIKHTLSIKNKTPLPFSNSIIQIEYFNKLMNVSEKLVFHVPVHPMGTQKLTFSLKSQYCGVLTVKAVSMKTFDYLKLFSTKKKLNSSCSTVIMPELFSPVNKSEYKSIFTEDSDVFSKVKSGDDPSEIFALKDFIPGDKPNRIHWNLSLKHDNLIVRHYSQPICTSHLLIFDFHGTASADNIPMLDAVAETAFSVSFLMLEKKPGMKLAYYDKEIKEVNCIDIKDENDIVSVFMKIFAMGPVQSDACTAFIKEQQNEFSEIYYITSCEESLSAVLSLDNSAITPVIIRNENDSLKSNDNISVVYTGNTAKGISDLII